MIADEETPVPVTFVGREQELDRLMALLEDAAQGRGRVVLVSGEAGVGKSTLVTVVLAEAAAHHQAFCARGQCLDQDAPVPYLPFTDALRAYFGLTTSDNADAVARKIKRVLIDNAANLAGLVPVVGAVLAASIGITMSVQKEFGLGRSSASEERDKLFYALYQLVKRISQKQPLVLLLDDLHWADRASLDLLHFLAREIRHDRILLIGAYRPEGLRDASGRETHLAEIRRRLIREDLLVELPLAAFEKVETRRLVLTRLPGAAFPDDFYDWLFRRSEGNPYYTEQILESLDEKGFFAHNAEGPRLSGPIKELPVPENLQALLQSRLQVVDDAGKDILQIGAAIGTQFTFGVLHCASGKSEDELCAGLEQALRLDLIKELRLDDDDGFCFVHSLWREALYEKIPAFKCHRLHRKIAECLECRLGDRADSAASQLAHHYRRAGNQELAVKYLQIAAGDAQKVLALDDALQYYDTALEVLADGGAGPVRRHLLLARGEVNYELSRPQEAMADFQAVLRDAMMADDEQSIAASRLRIGQIMSYWESDWEGATPLFLEALPLFEKAGDIPNLVQAYRWLGNGCEFSGQWSEAETYYHRALQTARGASFREGEAIALRSLGYLQYIRGNWPQAIALLSQSAAMLEALQLPPALADAYRWLALTYDDMGEYELELDYLLRELEIRRKIGQRKMPGTHLGLGWCYLQRGQLDLAREHLQRALDETEKASQLKADAESFYGQYWLAVGDPDKALDYALKSIETYEQAKYPEMLSSGKMYLGVVLAARGDLQKAIDVSLAGLEIALQLNAKKIAADLCRNLGRYYEQQGQWQQARTYYERAAQIYRALSARKFLPEVEAALLRLAGRTGAIQ